MIRLLLLLPLFLVVGCGTVNAPCVASSDSRCAGEWVGSECTTNRSHTCIKTGGGALTPVCDCQDTAGNPVPDDYGELAREFEVWIRSREP